MSNVEFPFENEEQYGDVRTIAERAGIELRTVDGEEGIPFCCGQRMQVKGGIWGPDHARCGSCRQEIMNLASPHINGGYVLSEAVLEAHGDSIWTIRGAAKLELEEAENNLPR